MVLKAFMLCYDVSSKIPVYSVEGETMKVHCLYYIS